MTTTFTSLKALGKAMRQRSPIDLQIPVEMQLALLGLLRGDEVEPRSVEPSLSVDQNKREMTERANDGKQAQEARLAG